MREATDSGGSHVTNKGEMKVIEEMRVGREREGTRRKVIEWEIYKEEEVDC